MCVCNCFKQTTGHNLRIIQIDAPFLSVCLMLFVPFYFFYFVGFHFKNQCPLQDDNHFLLAFLWIYKSEWLLCIFFGWAKKKKTFFLVCRQNSIKLFKWNRTGAELNSLIQMKERLVEYMSLMTPTKQFTMQICRSFPIFVFVWMYTFEAHLFGAQHTEWNEE